MLTTNNNKQILDDEIGTKQAQVAREGTLERLKWASLRLLLSTVGRLSKGIRTGYCFGFDSGTMLDYVYVNRAHGYLGIGILLDRFYLNAIGWRAIRARRALLQRMLRLEIEQNCLQDQQPTRLLDVASGPGRYLQSLLELCGPERGDLRILCRDLAVSGLLQGEELAKERGLDSIFYEQGDAFAPAPTDDLLGGAPNVVVVSGLYELLLDDEMISALAQATLRSACSRWDTLLYDADLPSAA